MVIYIFLYFQYFVLKDLHIIQRHVICSFQKKTIGKNSLNKQKVLLCFILSRNCFNCLYFTICVCVLMKGSVAEWVTYSPPTSHILGSFPIWTRNGKLGTCSSLPVPYSGLCRNKVRMQLLYECFKGTYFR